ncbi:hypothetical protein V6N12_065450 [Hibiscus sabdariffa]|uniref:Uncharacterized protein n=1 Tax=Hibiscus sabdariffa TaxID=183260 RepID=A0ABR2G972_9ROSI
MSGVRLNSVMVINRRTEASWTLGAIVVHGVEASLTLVERMLMNGAFLNILVETSTDEWRHLRAETSRTLGESIRSGVEETHTLVKTRAHEWSFLDILVETS